jgi:hypothetical protein
MRMRWTSLNDCPAEVKHTFDSVMPRPGLALSVLADASAEAGVPIRR